MAVHYFECPNCNKIEITEDSYGSKKCYCQYTSGNKKENQMNLKVRKNRKVKGPFKITGFSNTGFGKSARIHLEKDGEEFDIRFSTVEKKIIGKTELNIMLFESSMGNWGIHGHNDDYITVDGAYRLKEEITGSFYLANIKYHKGLQSTRYVRYILKNMETLDTDNDREYEVFAKDFGEISEFWGGKQMTLREEKPSGSYVWRPVK
jgi:hypothetical protein